MDNNNDFTRDATTQEIVTEAPELRTELRDDELNQIIDARIQESKNAYELIKLDDRRKTNEKYWLGQHYKPGEVEGLEYIDNMIYQDTEQRIRLAVGKTPDIIVVPGDNNLNARKNASIVERVLDIDISTKEKKRLLKNGLRHNHIHLIGICKPSWNPSKGQYGDYEFKLCDPRKVLISHTGRIPEDGYTSDNCDLIVEIVEEPVAVVMAKFPNKANELKEMLGASDGSRLATTIKYQEVWYTYHDKQGNILEGVCWRYNHLVLRNIKNPYFDFQGYDKPIYNNFGQIQRDMFGNMQTERLFRNFFERPRKPYIFFSYENLGRTPIDDTSALEQSVPLQRNLNKTGKQIRDISDGITNKYAFDNTITQDQARLVSSNPKEPIWMDVDGAAQGGIKNHVANFTNDGPPPVLFQELGMTRMAIDAKFQTQGNTRGANIAPGESGISKQITREGDLVSSDDMSDIVLERVVEEMAGWAMQFMKLMYVDPHFKSKMGKDGALIQEMIQQDMIDDGVSLAVRGSISDKATARNNAINLGQSGSIDPLTMFEEMDAPNPKERTQRLLLFKMGEGPEGDGFANYMNSVGIELDKNPAESNMQPEPTGEEVPGMPGGEQQPPNPGMPPLPF